MCRTKFLDLSPVDRDPIHFFAEVQQMVRQSANTKLVNQFLDCENHVLYKRQQCRRSLSSSIWCGGKSIIGIKTARLDHGPF